MKKKLIILCADDYGQTPAISKGILTLIQRQRLSATSCLVNTPYFSEHAAWLKPWQALIDIGLHFNLTEGKALSPLFASLHGKYFFSLPFLLSKALYYGLKQNAIEAECHAQLDQFEGIMKSLPDFIDGHQHVHQFPIIREALITVYKKRFQAKPAYIRLVKPTFKIREGYHLIKKIQIHFATRPYAFQRMLKQHNIIHNEFFSGIYPFKKSFLYSTFFPSFLNEMNRSQTKDFGLILCHPASPFNQELIPSFQRKKDFFNDTMIATREAEYNYLMSDQFLKDCESYHCELTSGKSLLHLD